MSSKFPSLYHARPEWPNKDDDHLYWVGLHTKFKFAHGPHDPVTKVGKTESSERPQNPFFCPPRDTISLIKKIVGKSDRGSILVTGYRGTGKTSIVLTALHELEREQRELEEKNKANAIQSKRKAKPWAIAKVNMATVADAHDVLSLTYEALIQLFTDRKEDKSRNSSEEGDQEKEELSTLVEKLHEEHRKLSSTRRIEYQPRPLGVNPEAFFTDAPRTERIKPGEQVYEREAISVYQEKLIEILREARSRYRIVFVFDEIDKLMPVDRLTDDDRDSVATGTNNLASLQKIVADLKRFLSEAPSHQIFIAGKDVDDSWAEDQNKGEGIFESIFASNIHIPSIFTLELEPCQTCLPEPLQKREKKETDKFYTHLAKELGIPKNSLVYRTALLVLPHIAEYEISQLLGGESTPNEGQIPSNWIEVYKSVIQNSAPRKDEVSESSGGQEPEACRGVSAICCSFVRRIFSKTTPKCCWSAIALPTDSSGETHSGSSPDESSVPETLPAMSERTKRRLRTLLGYLTYKGRGIPRKILRELYGMVRPVSVVSDNDPGYYKVVNEKFVPVPFVLAFPQHHLQKMGFYASIVEHLDQNFAQLRGLNDKGRVAVFHILDYLLKFYPGGFSNRDLEHAPFMTNREEYFPSRQLAMMILRLMDGRLWRLKESRGAQYRMLHHVSHDLAVMFLRYGPEQIELRHTLRDFRDELPQLRRVLVNTNAMRTEERLVPIHAQLRMARILELCGRHYDARLAYYVALRWIRLDLAFFEKVSAETDSLKGEMIGKLWPISVDRDGERVGRVQSDLLLEVSSLPSRHPVAFATYLIDVHLALGRLLEEVGETRGALQHYEEAFRLCEPYLARRIQAKKKSGADPDHEEGDPSIAYAKFLWESLRSLGEPIVLVQGETKDENDLSLLLSRKPPMEELKLDDIPQGFAHICNHAATAYSKLWERSSSDAHLLRALFYLDLIGDEYGVIDQMFFLGQVMVRRRDLPAGAMWYRAALLKIRRIRAYSEAGSGTQTGAAWQTPPALSTTEAQILAALGDVVLASGGFAFYDFEESRFPSSKEKAEESVWRFILKELGGDGISVDDRWEEWFYTLARSHFEAGGREVDAADVFLRQLETRFQTFVAAAAEIDATSSKNVIARYAALNSWTSFWRGVRILVHQSLAPLTSLTRNEEFSWGRVSDFRRMGSTLGLAGSMLLELGLRPRDAESRKILRTTSDKFGEDTGSSHNSFKGFYKRFVSCEEENGSDSKADQTGYASEIRSKDSESTETGIQELQNPLLERYERLRDLDFMDAREWIAKIKGENPPKWWEFGSRINVNRAASDLQTVFAYLVDKKELISSLPDDMCDFGSKITEIGPKSSLFATSGRTSSSSNIDREPALPIGFVLKNAYEVTKMQAGQTQESLEEFLQGFTVSFSLLVLSEKALIASYLCYRDCVPDYSYAGICVRIGELYASALFKLGSFMKPELPGIPEKLEESFCEAIDKFTELSKRFLMKAIDVLRREREQNRNTFHLMSEAWFNLGDVLLIRLLAISKSDRTSMLFSAGLREKVSEYFRKVANGEVKSRGANSDYDDLTPEDLRRQVADAYCAGLRSVRDEISDFKSRYRDPGDIFYSNRNIMDPVLHFRICRSVRMRHFGAAGVKVQKPSGKEIQKVLIRLNEMLSGYESPQSGNKEPSEAWGRRLVHLLRSVNEVRTDRGPLQVQGEVGSERIGWTDEKEVVTRNQADRLLFWH